MKVNEASWDRIVRVLLGAVLLYLGFGGVIGGTLSIVVGIVGLISLLTGLIGWCPIYALFKMSTNHA
jgi:hypothetical protein